MAAELLSGDSLSLRILLKDEHFLVARFFFLLLVLKYLLSVAPRALKVILLV